MRATINELRVTKKIGISIPDATHERLQRWADVEGTKLADLAAYILRREAEQAEKHGLFIPVLGADPEVEAKDDE